MNKIKKNITATAASAVALILTAIFAAAGFFGRSDALLIGMFEDQQNFFDKKEIIEAAAGKPVEFRYYDSVEAMKIDIASGALGVYVCPIFEFIASGADGKAIATIEAEYVLAAAQELGTPAQVGITEKYISTYLLQSSNRLDSKKISLQSIDAESKIPFINEGIIDCAIFRTKAQAGLLVDVRLSELGFRHDMLVVSNNLLLKHDGIVKAIFSASSKISQRLPSEDEIKNAELFLFQIGAIKERRGYQHYVHIE